MYRRVVTLGPLAGCTRVTPTSGNVRGHVVLVPGMHHDAWYFGGLQVHLATRGYESVALTLKPFSLLRTSTAMDGGRLKDIQAALRELDFPKKPVLLGHSQGGLLVQMFMDNESRNEQPQCRGIVLYATGALGQLSPFMDLVSQVTGALGMVNMMTVAAHGYNTDADEMKKLFFLPTTTSTNVTGETITLEEYWRLTSTSNVSCIGEGTTTYTHPLYSRWILHNPRPFRVPSLVVFAEQDVLYRAIHRDWLVKYHGSSLLVATNQAHCLGDPGWEDSVANPLADWLDDLYLH